MTSKSVPEELAGALLDSVVRKLFDLPWTRARSAIETGKVQLDGVTVLSPSRRVRKGGEISLRMAAPRPRADELERSRILYLDAHIVVVNKPPGVSTVPYEDDREMTLDRMLREHLSRIRIRGERTTPAPLGVVHRLDKETSGVMVFTRTWVAKKSLSLQFRKHTIERTYLALAHGLVREATFRSHFVEDRGDGVRGSIERMRARGKRVADGGELAITHVRTRERISESVSLVECRLETGRTHQIRIHLSEAGHPVLGDRVYLRGYRREIVPAARLMLHATELGFVHPATEEKMHFREELPRDMCEVIDRLRKA